MGLVILLRFKYSIYRKGGGMGNVVWGMVCFWLDDLESLDVL